MAAPLLAIETDTRLPKRTEVVVIGAGIIGTSATYYLARRGVPVVLIEKGRVGAEQSSRNWGWCRQQNRDARELPMATKALELWDRFAAELGEDVGFCRCGLTYLSNDEAEIETWANWCKFAATQGVISRALDAKAAAERGAVTGKTWKGGVFSESDGVADPSRAVPMQAKGVIAAGGQVLQNCAVRGILTQAGRVSGVVTEHGEIECSQVVMAGGAWASSFCHQLGMTFPQASIRQTILSIASGSADLPDALHTSQATITRRGDNAHTLAISGRGQVDPSLQKFRFAQDFVPMFARRWRLLSPGAAPTPHETRKRWALDRPTPMEQHRVLDPKPNASIVKTTLDRSQTLLPALQGAKVQASWAGFIDSTPDGVPVIDASDSLPGFLLAAGFSGHGFGIGPAAGHLVADLITGAPPIVDPEQFRLSRLGASSWGKVAEF
ncbi:FAD-binding oxidoreductase [Tropicibacter sp. R16_0]|uniref:NAD(P)/FAD-dependent oxidoreductase n=1 Tax=Tropicibacter sp. R16_0 TaxID=2821102 RepID=UPI001ADA0C66|nr:FAD-binding oxidoreductase [Tropicibacter sp. R16_0]MBO9452200.1 FAD-binding oxidoreductase [Tropicibacter sp. R16_0]